MLQIAAIARVGEVLAADSGVNGGFYARRASAQQDPLFFHGRRGRHHVVDHVPRFAVVIAAIRDETVRHFAEQLL